MEIKWIITHLSYTIIESLIQKHMGIKHVKQILEINAHLQVLLGKRYDIKNSEKNDKTDKSDKLLY